MGDPPGLCTGLGAPLKRSSEVDDIDDALRLAVLAVLFLARRSAVLLDVVSQVPLLYKILQVGLEALALIGSVPVLLMIGAELALVAGGESHFIGYGHLKKASCLDFLPLPEAAAKVEGGLRRSGDEALHRSGDGSLRRSSLLEDLLSPLGATFSVRPKFSRPRTSSSFARMKRFAQVISSFIVATDSPKSSSELGDVLVFSHPEGHEVSICLWDDTMGLKLLQERGPELPPIGDGAIGE
ncbi:hypothetical protein AAC387_Pa06g2068 [Persea americana]